MTPADPSLLAQLRQLPSPWHSEMITGDASTDKAEWGCWCEWCKVDIKASSTFFDEQLPAHPANDCLWYVAHAAILEAQPPEAFGDCERGNTWTSLLCTRDAGHDGHHIARDTNGVALLRWDDGGKEYEPPEPTPDPPADRSPVDAKEWGCPTCGADILFNACTCAATPVAPAPAETPTPPDDWVCAKCEMLNRARFVVCVHCMAAKADTPTGLAPLLLSETDLASTIVIDVAATVPGASRHPQDWPDGLVPLITPKQRKVLELWAASYHKLGSDPTAAPHLSEETRRFKLLLADALTAALAALDAQRQASASVRREAIEECIALVNAHKGAELKCEYVARLEALRDQPRVSPRQPSGGKRNDDA